MDVQWVMGAANRLVSSPSRTRGSSRITRDRIGRCGCSRDERGGDAEGFGRITDCQVDPFDRGGEGRPNFCDMAQGFQTRICFEPGQLAQRVLDLFVMPQVPAPPEMAEIPSLGCKLDVGPQARKCKHAGC